MVKYCRIWQNLYVRWYPFPWAVALNISLKDCYRLPTQSRVGLAMDQIDEIENTVQDRPNHKTYHLVIHYGYGNHSSWYVHVCTIHHHHCGQFSLAMLSCTMVIFRYTDTLSQPKVGLTTKIHGEKKDQTTTAGAVGRVEVANCLVGLGLQYQLTGVIALVYLQAQLHPQSWQAQLLATVDPAVSKWANFFRPKPAKK